MKHFLKFVVVGLLLLLSALFSTLPSTANASPALGPMPVGGTVAYVRARHSGKCMDVYGGSTANGADVIQWMCNDSNHQTWMFRDLSNGYYQLRAAHSNKCLDVSGRSTANGADIIQWTCNSSSTNQQWKIISVGGGYFKLQARHSTKCADVSGGSTANGADIIQWLCHTGSNQQWYITLLP